MSNETVGTPAPVTEATVPFVPTTTPNMERANRLMSLRAHPGFRDLIRLSQELMQEASDVCADYPGWDPQQIVILKVRMQVAKEHHLGLLAKIEDAIQTGITEGREMNNILPAKSARDVIDQGDFVRQAVLTKFEDFDGRPAGSY